MVLTNYYVTQDKRKKIEIPVTSIAVALEMMTGSA